MADVHTLIYIIPVSIPDPIPRFNNAPFDLHYEASLPDLITRYSMMHTLSHTIIIIVSFPGPFPQIFKDALHLYSLIPRPHSPQIFKDACRNSEERGGRMHGNKDTYVHHTDPFLLLLTCLFLLAAVATLSLSSYERSSHSQGQLKNKTKNHALIITSPAGTTNSPVHHAVF